LAWVEDRKATGSTDLRRRSISIATEPRAVPTTVRPPVRPPVGTPAGPPAGARRSATFAALDSPPFRLYLSGQAVSLCGTWMQTIALGWLLLSLGATPTELGLVVAAQFLPVLLLGAYGGLLADRMDKRRLLMATQLAAGGLAALLAVVDYAGLARLWLVAVVALAIGVVNSVDNPTRQSIVGELVGPGRLTNAVSLNSAMINAARAIGPGIAGVLIAVAGTGTCFLLNAASFGVMFIVLRRLGHVAPAGAGARPGRSRGQLRDGLAYVARSPELRIPLIMMAVIGTLAYEFQIVLPLIAKQTFQGGSLSYSLLTAAMGAGAFAGGLLLARRGRVGAGGPILAAAGFGIVLVLTALAPTLPIAALAMVGVGAASVAFTAAGNSRLQLASAPAMRGRVMALWSVAFIGSTPVGGPIVGAICGHWGPRAGLAVGGVAALGAAGYGALALRRHAARPGPEELTATPVPAR
jgi:MFS family permease